MSGLNRYRATLYAYADAGTEGAMESQYVQQPAPGGDGDWWCAEAQVTASERTLAAKAGHDLDGAFLFDDYVPVSDNGLFVIGGVQYLIRGIMARQNGRAQVEVLAQRTEDVFALLSAPIMSISGTQPLEFAGVSGGEEPADQVLTIDNAGGGTLPLPTLGTPTYSAGASDWITTLDITGASAPYTLTVGVTMGIIEPGVYQGTLYLSAAGAAPVAFAVRMSIGPQPVIAVDSTPLAFVGIEGGAITAVQTIPVSDGGGPALVNLAVGNASDAWLIVSYLAGVISVSCDPSAETPGNLTGTFDVTADGAVTVTIGVAFDVNAEVVPVIELTPSSLTFLGVAGGAVTADKTIVVADANGIGLVNVGVGNASAPWVVPSIVGLTISVHGNPADEVPGNLGGSFDVTADNAPTVSVPVTFDVDAVLVPVIELVPSSLSFAGIAGGAVTADKTIAVSDASGIGLVNVGVGNASDPWLVPSIVGATISVHGDPAAEVPSNLDGTFDVTADNAFTRTVPVHFDVDAPPVPIISLSPSSLTLANGVAGGAVTADKTIAVSDGAGVGLVNVGVSGASAAWLIVSIVGATISVHGDPSAQTAGLKNGTFNVTADNAPTVSVPVAFNVTAAPVPVISLTPSGLTFAGTAGGANTAVKTIAVTSNVALVNVGVSGASAAWLVPSIVGSTISVYGNPSAQTAGTKTGSFNVTADNAATVNVPVTFNVAAAATVALQLSQSTAIASGLIGGTNPVTQNVTISGVPSGGPLLAGPVRGTITYPLGDSGWLTATITGTGPTYNLALAFNITGKSAPSSTARFTISDASATNSPVTFDVILLLSTAPITNFAAPLYTIMRGTAFNATFSTTTGEITYNPFLNNGIIDPDGDPTSPTFYYGPNGIGPRGAGGGNLATVTNVATKAALLAAAASAQNGDWIRVTASFTDTSTLTLPAKGAGFVLIDFVNPPTTPEGRRATRAAFNSAGTPIITYNGPPVYYLRHAAGSDGWHLRNWHVKNASPAEIYGLYWWGYPGPAGNGQDNVADMPERLKMERCWFENPSGKYCARVVYLSGRYGMFRHNIFEGGAKNGFADSQGIYILNSLGDFDFFNNEIQGASENVAMGGGRAWMGVQNYNHNMWFHSNYLVKPLAWLTNPAIKDQIKNFWETKHGRYIVVEHNYGENHNGAAQSACWVVKVSPYAAGEVTYLRTEDITIWKNYVTNAVGSYEVSTGDQHPPLPSVTNFPTRRVEFRDNAFVNPYTQSSGVLRKIIGGFATPTTPMSDITIHHNWHSDTNSFVVLTPSIKQVAIPGFYYRNNIEAGNVVYQSVIAPSYNNKAALDGWCGPAGWIFANNWGVSSAGATNLYGSGAVALTVAPHSNRHFSTLGTPGVGAVASGTLGAELNADRTVKATSAGHNGGTDGIDIGPNWSLLQAALAAKVG